MPHNSDAASLEELCCKSIGQNMDSLWCREYNENLHGKDYMYLLGPFSDLPGILLCKLIRYLKSHGLLKIGHLQLLLDSSLLELDLSRLSNNMGSILNTVANRCVNLRHLDLSRNAKLPLQGQIALFSTARQLESIDLSDTNTSDRVMSVIGAYCLQLRELNVANSGVTDLGLNSLSTSVLSHAACAGDSLVSLTVDGCDVSPDSAFGVLNSMPNIVSFDHPETVLGVEMLLLRRPELAPLALTELRGSSTAGLEVAAPGCPAAELLQLELDADDDAGLAPAGQLARLARLRLALTSLAPCAGLAPLLAARGAGLAELTLMGVHDLSADALLRLCPALRRLELEQCSFTEDAPAGPPPAQLERLWLLQEAERPAPVGLLRRALAAPPLEHVSVHHCDALDDALLQDVLDAGGLRRLRTLNVAHCNRLGAGTAHQLAVQCARLEELSLRWCADVSCRDAADLRRTVAENGWRLTVNWR